ncbi:hypothetical protein [Butyrivibrio sp. AE2032]|uniref:hypothetical protein n=1 Tax=Butyrivibrio sp. AE2032 TaxID=1458463 RepID=UPI000559497F|nr:hypothetical protein [Butyrivibrio sp. AE2032]
MKKISNIAGIISGIISIVFSFVIKSMSAGSYERSQTYGGDAYTGIQNASAQAANNVKDLTLLVQSGIFAFLLVFGIALICFFLSRLFEETHTIENMTASTLLNKTDASTVPTSPVAKPEIPSAKENTEEKVRGVE